MHPVIYSSLYRASLPSLCTEQRIHLHLVSSWGCWRLTNGSATLRYFPAGSLHTLKSESTPAKYLDVIATHPFPGLGGRGLWTLRCYSVLVNWTTLFASLEKSGSPLVPCGHTALRTLQDRHERVYLLPSHTTVLASFPGFTEKMRLLFIAQAFAR